MHSLLADFKYPMFILYRTAAKVKTGVNCNLPQSIESYQLRGKLRMDCMLIVRRNYAKYSRVSVNKSI